MNLLSINFYICNEDTDLHAFCRMAAAAGAKAVGLTVRAVDELDVISIKRLLARYGLMVSSLNSAGYFLFSDAASAAKQERLNERLVAAAAALEAGTLVVIPGGIAHGSHSIEVSRALVREGIHDLARRAARDNVQLGIEPIHPLGILKKGCVNTLHHAVDIARGHRNLGLTIDFFHSWWDPDFEKIFASDAGLIRLVQICNVAAPDHPERFDRELLGQGFIDVRAVLRTIMNGGYRGFFEFEMFPEHLRGRSVANVIEAIGREYALLTELPTVP